MKKILALFVVLGSIVVVGCGSAEADGATVVNAPDAGRTDIKPTAPVNTEKGGATMGSMGVDDASDKTGTAPTLGGKGGN